MTERIKSLEEVLAASVGGPCAFPEKLKIPIEQTQMKLERNGVNGDLEDDLRFEKDVMRMVKKHKITEEEAQKLLLALKN